MGEIIKKKSLIFYFVTVFIGIFTIWHQLHFENFWLDEMNSFWVADSNLSFEETILRQKKSDFHNPFLFNLILKEFLYFTEYEPNTARLLPFFLVQFLYFFLVYFLTL